MSKSRKFILRAITASAIMLSAGSASAQQVVRLGLDWAWLPYHAPLLLGVEKGFYKDEGIQLEMEPGRGSGTTAIMLGQGNYDIAHINTTNAAAAIAKGVPIKVISVYQTKTASSFIGLAGHVELKDIDSLKKYKIGSTPGGSDQLNLKIFKRINHIKDDELNVISLDANAKQTALLANRIDLISGDGFAYASIIRGAGQTPVMLSFADYGVPLLGFGYSVNKSFAEAKPEVVKAFLRATQRSWVAALADIDGACKLAREKVQIAGSQAQCVDYFKGLIALSSDPRKPGWGKQTDEMWTKLLSTLSAVGEIKGDFKVSDFYTNEYLPE
jgi:NitT/TauT family transport system substrate-binding protein